ncbi:hypothetical protein NDU88_004879 [Pleurodeles waltl]|uniref:Uncharacterized protein n=1 Tax=Pleurodeles waltl TaxID=8319 RepID=A0AAV7W9V8_PLEWA|nr:hypothetical protein NDU88_004879 [Pleurodeles waltl]
MTPCHAVWPKTGRRGPSMPMASMKIRQPFLEPTTEGNQHQRVDDHGSGRLLLHNEKQLSLQSKMSDEEDGEARPNDGRASLSKEVGEPREAAPPKREAPPMGQRHRRRKGPWKGELPPNESEQEAQKTD